jgi:hypothetical protein
MACNDDNINMIHIHDQLTLGELQRKSGWPRQVPEGVAGRPFSITPPVQAPHFFVTA